MTAVDGFRHHEWLTEQEVPPAPRRPRPHPRCTECTLGETGVCGRHGYSLLRSVAGTRAPGDPDGMRGTWETVL
jgi:hypothetical protein